MLIALRNKKIFVCILAASLLVEAGVDSQAQRTSKLEASRAQQQIIAGPNVQVSKGFDKNPHGEIHLAANPKNPNNLLGGSMVWSAEKNTYMVVAYASFDGGKTWAPTLALDDNSYHSDPAVGFGPDGVAYFLQIIRTPYPDNKPNTYIHRSKDGGKTWLAPAIFPMYDRHFIVVDDTGGKYHNSIYIHAQMRSLPGIDGVRAPRTYSILRSRNGGETFEPPVQLGGTEGHFIMAAAPGVVLSDGTLVIPFGEVQGNPLDIDFEGSPTKPNGVLKVITSEDGGETFSKASIIGDVKFGRLMLSNTNHFGFAADRSGGPFRDRLYAVWSNINSGGADILLSYSSDKGKTWSKAVTVNDERRPLNLALAGVHFQPVAAVNRNGVVGVRWYDRTESSNTLDWSVRFAASLDGGQTFLPSVKVSEVPFTHKKNDQFEVSAVGSGGGYASRNRSTSGEAIKLDIIISQFYIAGGHTGGIAADANGIFHPFWVDNRTGVSQLWTTSISVPGKAIRNGSEDLAVLEDISGRVLVDYTNTRFNPATGLMSVDARIRNVSNETISGSIKVRVLKLTSPAGGIPKIITADNGLNHLGAVWDFTSLLAGGKLGAGQQSEAKHLEFALSDLPPLEESIKYRNSRNWEALQLIGIEARVFGKVEKKTAQNEQ